VAKNFKPESDVRVFPLSDFFEITMPTPFLSQCIVANVDADAKANAPLAEKYGVKSFPTIKFFSKGHKDKPEDYEGGRTEADFTSFLNEKCGTQRAIGGGLTDKVGIMLSHLICLEPTL